MTEVLVLLLLALLGLVGGHGTHRASCPPASGLHDSVCGDVDGRGRLERVGIELRGGSSAWLVVRFANRAVATRLVSYGTEHPGYDAKYQTFVNGLAPLDTRRSLEIVVTVHEGASTSFGQLFRLEGRALRRIPVPAEAGGEFAYEGSVTHFDVIDCPRRRSGLVRVSGYGYEGGSHYLQERTLYRLDGQRLLKVRHEVAGLTLAKLGRFPEFAEPQPFPHCMAVRSERTH